MNRLIDLDGLNVGRFRVIPATTETEIEVTLLGPGESIILDDIEAVRTLHTALGDVIAAYTSNFREAQQ